MGWKRAGQLLAFLVVGLLAFGPPVGAAQSQAAKAPQEASAAKKARPDLRESVGSKKAPARKRAAVQYDYGSIYLLRGLANIFSRGMDTLGAELEKNGIDVTVTNHAHAFDLADKLAKKYKADKSVLPVIIIGHSLGANKALTMSRRLGQKGVPVRLVVLFDATADLAIPPNVEEVINFYNPTSMGVAVKGDRGFKGKIDARNLSGNGFGHISIDKSSKLHAEVVAKVKAILKERRFARRK